MRTGCGYTYDDAGRMESFAINGVVQAEYEYNALGQQVIRRLTQTGEEIHNVFDLDGNRIAEYDNDAGTGTSTLIREYIWMNGVPVGVQARSLTNSHLLSLPLRFASNAIADTLIPMKSNRLG